MKPPKNPVPVFALDATTTWDDMENAMNGCVEYQTSKLGKILPLMLFAPMTAPENPDAWEPMKVLPENMLIVSIERHVDASILKALKQAEAVCGEVRHAATFPAVQINFNADLPLADAYEQMTRAEIFAFAVTYPGKDDPSFFFLRGAATVKVFASELRNATRKS
jgi:hypothetical protein